MANVPGLVTDPTTNAIAGTVPLTQRVLVYLIAKNPTANGPQVGLIPVAQYQFVEPHPPGAGQPLRPGRGPAPGR